MPTQPLPDDYFRGEPFVGALLGETFASYTCQVCGARMKTWASFKTHRQTAHCGEIGLLHPDTLPEWTKAALRG